jgi:hypothetical protein
MPHRARSLVVLGFALLILPGLAVLALAGPVVPTSQLEPVAPLAAVPHLVLPAVDVAAARAEDLDRDAAGLPPRFALPNPLDISPETDGSWETLADPRFLLWRLRLSSPGALSINLGFDRYRLPKGSRLVLHAAGQKALEQAAVATAREFSEHDNSDHGQLWTPVVLTDDLVIELTLPAESRHDYELHLVSVNAGYRLFGEPAVEKAGSCNVDVVCPEGDPWLNEIASVGVYTLNGTWTCTGAMINNSAEDGTPLFLSAYHCGVTSVNAATMVVYWNFQSPVCGQQGGGSLGQYQSGALFRARYSTSDFCLVQLQALPDPAWQVAYAGWDRSTADPPQAVAIHHPNTDEKSISFEYQPTTTTSYLSESVPGDGTHIRVADWDLGTTEPGSSGSPLFDPNHRIVGQLHGGYAACGNDLSDWYGRLSTSWNGGGDAASRLRDWLDPLGAQPLSVDTWNPYAVGLRMTPSGGLSAQGPQGGPFTPASQDYVLQNLSTYPIVVQLAADAAWVEAAGSYSLEADGTDTVTVSLGPAAAALPTGFHSATVTVTNLTDGLGNTSRPVSLQVGQPEVIYSFPLDTDPGWSTEGLWAFGQPTGAGGQYGGPDPAAGYTGPNVYGYNLAGDYENNLPERHLTSPALDCTGLERVTLRFRRWLGVEQSAYDHAYLRVSTDSTTWTTIWQNTGEVADAAWMLVEYDLGAVADDQSTVYLRWTMGPTDGSWRYCGWNLDDIEIVAMRTGDLTGVTGGSPAPLPALREIVPNPFNPSTMVRFELPAAGRVELAIYDAAGRRVRLLAAQERPAGTHEVRFDGRGDDGRRLPAGVYLCRMQVGEFSQSRRLTLLK